MQGVCCVPARRKTMGWAYKECNNAIETKGVVVCFFKIEKNKYLTHKIPHGKTAACTCKRTSRNKDGHSTLLGFIVVLNCVQSGIIIKCCIDVQLFYDVCVCVFCFGLFLGESSPPPDVCSSV